MSKRIPDKKLLEARKAAAKQQKKQKRSIILLISALCVLAVLAVTILSSLPHYVKIEAVDGKYVDTETGITYLAAPQNYEPVSYTQKAYGKLDGNYVYPITGMNTSDWLAEDYYGILAVYYNEKLTLPALEDFSPVRIQVCRDQASAVVRVADISDRDDVLHIVDALLCGEETEQADSGTVVYTLRISSSQYTWLYYNVAYVVTPEGSYYYDRGTGRRVKADGLVDSYLNGSDTEADNTDSPNDSRPPAADSSANSDPAAGSSANSDPAATEPAPPSGKELE